ncbi:MAG: type II secretion system F family protein [Candidatus Paceibacterota bacterium]|jgi:type IV pilus assembly protein PilC
MAHFVFKAKKRDGEIYEGEQNATDRFELYKLIREDGGEIISVKEKGEKGRIIKNLSAIKLFNRVKTIEKINFARNLGSMLEAGLALSRAISVLERQTNNKFFSKIINNVNTEIRKGTTFSDSLAKHPKVFSQLFISMVHAGEQSGTLAESLKVVSIQMNNSYTLERRVRGALIYPSIIVFIMVLIAILMFLFVVPTLLKTFTEMNVTLPLTTRIVLGISEAFQNYGLLILIAFLAISGGLYWFSKQYIGKKIIHLGILKIPIIGSLVQEVNAARTARTLSSLLKAGVPVVESVSITSEVVQNIYFKAVLCKAEETIKKGELMSQIFNENSKLYPVFMAEMMSVGEETGQIAETLMNVATYYENDVEQKTKDMSTIIEPVLMVIIASAVGFFAISMISPMYSLVDAI